MELASSTPEIRDICFQRETAVAKLGVDAALELAQILSDMEAFDSFADFDATFGHQISDRGKWEKCFMMKTGHLIVFTAGHPRNLGTKPAPINWGKTTRLMITAFEQI
ncbi:hypothetical protein [Bradyrhizobium sp. I1.7.5]|uniref:hypothetical protein n=1 Tax=Bradyrhizobium sp. I1.7.5 TaxID=3156363 RepID=UPI003396E29F